MSRDDKSNIPPGIRERLEGELTDEERADLERVWALLGRAEPSSKSLPEAEDTWEGVHQHLEVDGAIRTGRRREDRGPSRRSRRYSNRMRWSVAGTVAAVLILAAVLWWNDSVAVITTPGSTATRTLPDGSTVELNADTRLEYSRRFSTISVLEAERRVVRLDGEAYFEVEPGDRPFIVETPTARVEVLGTAFSVRSRPENGNETQVALAEGRLSVTSCGTADTKLSLRAGQAVTLGAEGPLTAVRDTSVDRLLVWRRGGFAATAETLPEIVRALERRYGDTIRLDASIPETTRTDPLTLYYSDSVRVDHILYDIAISRNLSYRATADGYVLSQASGPQTSPTP